jgi:large subunit ribosomal protein L16
MILQPRKSRYKKAQKGKIYSIYGGKRQIASLVLKRNRMCARGRSRMNTKLIACESRRLSGVQIEAARVRLNRKIRKFSMVSKSKSNYKIMVFPNVPITKKPNEVRMGQGKGAVVRWIMRIKPTQMIFQLPTTIGKYRRLMRLSSAANKLPFKTLIV